MSEVEIPEHCHEILQGASVGTISTIRAKDGWYIHPLGAGCA